MARYSRAPDSEVTRRCFTVGFPSTWASWAGGTKVAEKAFLSSPESAMSRWALTVVFWPSRNTTESGAPCRYGSDFASQYGLRCSFSEEPCWYASTRYGPLQTGLLL